MTVPVNGRRRRRHHQYHCIDAVGDDKERRSSTIVAVSDDGNSGDIAGAAFQCCLRLVSDINGAASLALITSLANPLPLPQVTDLST